MPRVNATFNGVNRLISVAQGVSVVPVLDLFSDWKEWAQQNSGFAQAFLSSGGDVSNTGDVRGQYIDITNGWQIDIANSITFQGNIFRDSLDPIDTTLPVIKEEPLVKTATLLVSNLAGAVQVSTGSGLSTQQASQLSDLHQTLQSAGILSSAALANSPSDATAATQTAILEAIAQVKIILDMLGYTPGAPLTISGTPENYDLTTSAGEVQVRTTATNGDNTTKTVTRVDP